ncbi:MAG: hypothetical protein IJV64_09200, partial [Oscillospiraceae bacterium]|nr:hypothetical protein [Oscillospiraceae bacterium]
YEANVVTAEGLDAMVNGYDVTYNFEAKKDSTTNMKLVEAYVTITDAVPNGNATGSASSTTKGMLALVLPDDLTDIAGGAQNFQVYYAGSAPSNADINLALSGVLFTKDYEITAVAGGVYSLKDNTTNIAYPTALKAATLEQAEGLSGTITGAENKGTDIIVVEYGKTLTIANGATLTVDSLVADGNVVIENGGELVLKGKKLDSATTANQYGLVITENGDVTVKKGGKITGTGIDAKVNYNSTSLVSSGDITLGKLYVAGDATFEGGTVTASVDTQKGAKVVVEGDSVVTGTITVAANTGTVEIGGTATVATVTNNASASAVKMTSSTATVTSATNAITNYAGNAATGTVGDAKLTLSGTLPKGVSITGMSTGSKKSDTVYYLTSDTTAVIITVSNWGKAAGTVTPVISGYTFTPVSGEVTSTDTTKAFSFKFEKSKTA